MKQKIKKGVIAAAGFGTRFLPTTKAYPKELVPILSKPNIQYLVEEMIGAGINQIAIVHRHGDPRIKRYFTPDQKLEAFLKKVGKTDYIDSLKLIWKRIKKLRFIPQSNNLPYGNASPALAAKSFVGKDDFVYAYGDDLILETKPGSLLKKQIQFFLNQKALAVAAASQFPWQDFNRYSSIKYQKGSFKLEDVIEKPPTVAQAPSNFTLIGRFIVSNQIFEILKNQQISRGELWFTDSLRSLNQRGDVFALPIKNAKWLTTGDPLRWLKANIEYGLKDKIIAKDLKKFLKEKIK